MRSVFVRNSCQIRFFFFFLFWHRNWPHCSDHLIVCSSCGACLPACLDRLTVYCCITDGTGDKFVSFPPSAVPPDVPPQISTLTRPYRLRSSHNHPHAIFAHVYIPPLPIERQQYWVLVVVFIVPCPLTAYGSTAAAIAALKRQATYRADDSPAARPPPLPPLPSPPAASVPSFPHTLSPLLPRTQPWTGFSSSIWWCT